MLQRPTIANETILGSLRTGYGLAVISLEFLPLGNDANAGVFRIQAEDGRSYFLKVKKGLLYAASLLVPRYLYDQGITQVIPPLPTAAQELWQRADDDFALILYPFIEGASGMEAGLGDQHWVELGATLKQLHAIPLAPDLVWQVHKETFTPWVSELVRSPSTILQTHDSGDPAAQALRAFWRANAGLIDRLAVRAMELGSQLQSRPLEFVLCHADIHTANVLLAQDGGLFIIDWDATIVAPKERDLMFMLGEPREERLFFQGYGPAAIDWLALAYYRYTRAIEDLGDFAERIFLRHDLGTESKRDALQGLLSMFQPNEIVEAALATEAYL